MNDVVTKISALGTSGESLGELFTATRDRSGRYVLNRKKSSTISNTPTNRSANKVYVDSLDEAVQLLKTGNYLINLKTENGQRGLRSLDSITIDYAPTSNLSATDVHSTAINQPKLKTTRLKNWQKVYNAVQHIGTPALRSEILTTLTQLYPNFKETNLDADLRLITVNDPSRGHHQGHSPSRRTDKGHRYDLLFKQYDPNKKAPTFERYTPEKHGVWELYQDEGVSTKSKMRARAYPASIIQEELDKAEAQARDFGDFDFIDEEDSRHRVSRAIVLRRGQSPFRRALIKAYSGACAISGCTAIEVLEAAHIIPYKGDHTNRTDNGLLLRADIHTLFDLGLLWIESYTINISPLLSNTEYEKFQNLQLRLPIEISDRPSDAALKHHASIAKGYLNDH